MYMSLVLNQVPGVEEILASHLLTLCILMDSSSGLILWIVRFTYLGDSRGVRL